MVKSKWSNISKAIWDTWQWNMPRSKVILGMKIWMEFVNVLSVCTAFHQLSQILFSSFRNLSGLCVAIWNQFTEENLLRVKIPLKWKLNDDNWWVCLIGGCLFWDEDTNQEASGCRSHLWRNELVSRRNLVTEARFLFYGWHGYKGARRLSTTSVSNWLGCLKGGRVALHQRTSIPSLKGRSSPEISGDGSVHPRVDLPRFGDRWDLCFEGSLNMYLLLKALLVYL